MEGWGGVGRGWGVSERREGFAEPCAVRLRGWRGMEGVGS